VEPSESDPEISRSQHARLRFAQDRPIAEVVNDVQRARRKDVFIQPEFGRFVVRGRNAREHIIESFGEHVTSVRRSDAAHKGRLRDGTIRPANDEEFERLKDFVK
jgi:ferric-dicitrate binding protein FerR (iron transport regulator)